MKKTITFLSMLMISFNVFAQISTNETPFSFKEKLEKDYTQIITMPALNYEIVEEEDSIDNLNGLPPRFGFDFDVDINMENSGLWTDLPNKKGQLWRLEIYCPGALSVNLLYDKFYIPEGGKFFIYSPDKNKKLGAFTHRNNKGDKMHPGAFATSLILNDRIILEYYDSVNSNDIPVISIDKVIHGYRYIPFDFGDSDGDCEININCNEGENWQDEKTSVALIVVGGTRWCTGSLINNTRGDGAPFLLTANHCLSGLDAISNPNASTWTFLWNYESPTCANGTDFTPPSTSGATVRANNSASDFALLELDETPFDLNPSLCMYYNGWDKSGSAPSSTICIHHPMGDIKKISVSNFSPTSDGNFWKVIFNQGIVEHGSSGSPLYNNNSRVVGQLYGASAHDEISCLNQDGPTFYGKLSVSWNNSTDSRRRLKDWLDPSGTNPNTLDGAYLFPTNNNNISGPSVVCSSGATFSISNLLPGDTIVWDQSDNITRTSVQGSNPCTFASSSSGNGWIAAIIKNGCGDINLRQWNVYSGVPNPDDISVINIGPFYPGSNQICTDMPNDGILGWDNNGTMLEYGWDAGTWTVQQHPMDPFGIPMQSVQIIPPQGTSYGTSVRFRARNQCGWGAFSAPSVVLYGTNCSSSLLILSPNPSTSETTVSIESASKAQSFDETTEWDLEVYNQGQQLKARKMKIGGKHTTLNTSGWKEGVYIVRANYNGKVLTEKLVVKE